MRSIFLLLSLFISGSLCAQTPEANSKKTIVLTWRAVAFESRMSDLFIKSEGRELTLDIPAFGISSEYRYVGPPLITVYRRPSPVAASTEPPAEPLVVATLEINPEWKQVLIFLVPKRDGTLLAGAARSDNDYFQPGSFRAYNLTNQALVLRIDGRDQTIEPGRELQFRPPEGNRQSAVRYGMKNADGMRWLGSNYFSVPEGGRTTIILARTDSDYFRPIGTDGTVSPAKTLQVFSFPEASVEKK